MDETHLAAAARYVSLNPVRAGLVGRAAEWRWSSVRAHLAGEDDGLVTVAPLLDRIGRFANLVETEPGEAESERLAVLRAAETIGRPLGGEAFLIRIEGQIDRTTRPAKRGRKPRPRKLEIE